MTHRGFIFKTCSCQRKHNFLGFTQLILLHLPKLQCLQSVSVQVLKYVHAKVKYVQAGMRH